MACNCNQNNSQSDCGNPCGVSGANTVACESLPSQIQNFVDQFFGTVVKTEIDGVVSWSLPCQLDVGLNANPRADGEGLACYFLRLFSEGIIGLKGDKGDPGAAGTAGHSAYTVTLQGFTQPTLGAPNTTILTAHNPAILAGLYIFIPTSGYYLVNNADLSGALSVTLTNPVDGATGTITAGKLVVPSGYPGASVKGDKGDKGDIGNTGPAGNTVSGTNSFYFADIGTDALLPLVYAAVDFVNSSPTVLLPVAGTYRIKAVVSVLGKTGVVDADVASFKLRNTSGAQDVSGSEKHVNFIADTQKAQVVIEADIVTTLNSQTVALYGKCTTNAKIAAVALETTMTMVRLS